MSIPQRPVFINFRYRLQFSIWKLDCLRLGMCIETTLTKNAVHWQDEGQPQAETILLLEDEDFVRKVTGEVLQCAGYRVLTARNAVEAARIYQQHCGKIDLLLTDVVLPGESGSAFADRLKRDDPTLRVLFVTGYPEQMKRRVSEYDELLPKPFSTRTLLEKVRQTLDRGDIPIQSQPSFKLACGAV
jgi:CheY-like chemotaxis protein